MGKILLIPYALIGIPIHLYFLVSIGRIITNVLRFVIKTAALLTCKKQMKHGEMNLVAFSLMVLLLASLMSLTALIYCFLDNWRLIDGFYFSFVTFSTIGYGDIIPARNSGSKIFIAYLEFGLAIVAGVVDSFISVIEGKNGPSVESE